MNLITLPQALFVFYGALVLTCGMALGVVIGRTWKRRGVDGEPEPPEMPLRRVADLERELDRATDELQRALGDRDFIRELRPPRTREEAA